MPRRRPQGGRLAAADLLAVAAQLGRPPHPMSRVVARCPFGFPAVVEDLPYDESGRPLPTLYYLTCPSFVAAVSRLESDGGVRRWSASAAGDPALRRSLQDASAVTRRRRRELAARSAAPRDDAGASLTTGVAGVRDPLAVKCLHAHAAHALAHPAYLFGRAVLAEIADPWCHDERCAALVEARQLDGPPVAASELDGSPVAASEPDASPARRPAGTGETP
jgi:uncharacterized protein